MACTSHEIMDWLLVTKLYNLHVCLTVFLALIEASIKLLKLAFLAETSYGYNKRNTLNYFLNYGGIERHYRVKGTSLAYSLPHFNDLNWHHVSFFP